MKDKKFFVSLFGTLKVLIMLLEKRLPDLETDERLDCDMQDEIDNQMEQLKKYNDNIISLLGYKRAKEVKKAMINFLVEQL